MTPILTLSTPTLSGPSRVTPTQSRSRAVMCLPSCQAKRKTWRSSIRWRKRKTSKTAHLPLKLTPVESPTMLALHLLNNPSPATMRPLQSTKTSQETQFTRSSLRLTITSSKNWRPRKHRRKNRQSICLSLRLIRILGIWLKNHPTNLTRSSKIPKFEEPWKSLTLEKPEQKRKWRSVLSSQNWFLSRSRKETPHVMQRGLGVECQLNRSQVVQACPETENQEDREATSSVTTSLWPQKA